MQDSTLRSCCGCAPPAALEMVVAWFACAYVSAIAVTAAMPQRTSRKSTAFTNLQRRWVRRTRALLGRAEMIT
jgi:acyl-CoA synthetase (AMP-forming)/AMP-acid ligase II